MNKIIACLLLICLLFSGCDKMYTTEDLNAADDSKDVQIFVEHEWPDTLHFNSFDDMADLRRIVENSDQEIIETNGFIYYSRTKLLQMFDLLDNKEILCFPRGLRSKYKVEIIAYEPESQILIIYYYTENYYTSGRDEFAEISVFCGNKDPEPTSREKCGQINILGKNTDIYKKTNNEIQYTYWINYKTQNADVVIEVQDYTVCEELVIETFKNLTTVSEESSVDTETE